MKYIKHTNKKGYTIIETIIYIVLFTMLSLVFTKTLIVIMSSYTKIQGSRDIVETAQVVMERVSREFRQGVDLDGGSVYSATVSDITIHGEDADGVARTARFARSGDDILFYENGVLLGNLNGPNTVVTSFSANQVTTAEGKGVKMSITIENTKGVIVSKTFYNTIILRGAY